MSDQIEEGKWAAALKRSNCCGTLHDIDPIPFLVLAISPLPTNARCTVCCHLDIHPLTAWGVNGDWNKGIIIEYLVRLPDPPADEEPREVQAPRPEVVA